MNITCYRTKAVLKSDAKARTFCEKANELFEIKRNFDALTFYNKSIAFSKSKNILAQMYANRSAVFLEIGQYTECLKNIEWARQNEYPSDNIAILNKREETCKKLIEETIEEAEIRQDFFKLSYPANEKVPWIVDCVELRRTEKYGRGIYAKRNLKAGDIICIEKPAVSFLCSDVSYRRCCNCFKVALMNLIPCERIASIMFCSVECRDLLYSKAVFGLESILSDDVKLLTEMIALAGGKDEFHNFIEHTDFDNMTKSVFDFDFSDPYDPNYNHNILTCLLSLKAESNFIIDKRLPQIQKFVSANLSKRILKIMHVNRIGDSILGHEFKEYQDGSTISLFSSFMNHSCIANANEIYYDDKVITFIKRPVKAGEQIFSNLLSALEVQHDLSALETLMVYKCDCKACSGEVVLPKLNDAYTRSCENQWLLMMNYKSFRIGKFIFQNICDIINENMVPSDMPRYVLGCDMMFRRIASRLVLPCVP